MNQQPRGHQPESVHVNAVALTAVGLLVALVVIGLALWGLLHVWSDRDAERDRGIDDDVTLRTLPPTPSALDRLPELRRRLEAQQRANLERFEWTDRDNGVARIPIERAMQWVADHGLPEFHATTSVRNDREERRAP